MKYLSLILVLSFGLLFSCSKESEPNNQATPQKTQEQKPEEANDDPVSEVKPAKVEVIDRFLEDMEKGILYSSSTPKDKSFVKESLTRIKTLIAALEKYKDRQDLTKEYYRLYRKLTVIDKTEFDEERFEELYLFLQDSVYKIAKSQGIQFEDLTWDLYFHKFASSLEPYVVFSPSEDSSQWKFFQVPGHSELSYAKVQSNGKASESWLLSEVLDLSKVDVATLTIFQTVEVKKAKWESFSIKISQDFKENPEEATWTDYKVEPEVVEKERDWFDFNTQIDLSPYVGNKIVVAFYYSNPKAEETGAWEISSLLIEGAGEEIIRTTVESVDETQK